VVPGLGAELLGTEFDWMSYLWNLDTTPPAVGAPIGPGSGIFSIYTAACGGPCLGDLSFDAFLAGAEDLFGLGDPQAVLVEDLSVAHGVGVDVTP
jgi:hypothetical protein